MRRIVIPARSQKPAARAHGRRKFFALADVAAKARGQLSVLALLAVETVKRIDAIFDVEREINDHSIEDVS
jgi:hypothetical protein